MAFISPARQRSLLLTGISGLMLLFSSFSQAQSDVLILQKNGQNIRSYVPGQPIMLQTVYDQWFDGYVTALRDDSVFINNIPFHYKEIRALRRDRTKLNYVGDGTLLMIAGGGVLALNIINGLYRKDNAGQWFSTGGYIAAGALIAGGYLLRKASTKSYPIGKKYQLHYLDLHKDGAAAPGAPQPGNP